MGARPRRRLPRPARPAQAPTGATTDTSPHVPEMPHFFFDIHDHELSHRDEEGSEWPDTASAQDQGRRLLADIARDEAFRHDPLHLSVSIRDARRRVVATCALSLASTLVG